MSSLEIAAIREEVNTKQEQRNPDDSFKDELEDAPPPSEHVSLHLEAMNFDSDEDLMSDSEFNLGLESVSAIHNKNTMLLLCLCIPPTKICYDHTGLYHIVISFLR